MLEGNKELLSYIGDFIRDLLQMARLDWERLFTTLINWFKQFGSKDEINMLFLNACKQGHREIVQSFLDSEGNLNNIGYKDHSKKSWYEYVADGNGDNYDVVDFLIEHDKRTDKWLTLTLFYFLSKDSAKNSKPKWILELVKSNSKIDFAHTDKSGNICFIINRKQHSPSCLH